MHRNLIRNSALAYAIALLATNAFASTQQVEVIKSAPVVIANGYLQPVPTTSVATVLQQFGASLLNPGTQPNGALVTAISVPAGKQSTDVTFSLNCRYNAGLDTTYPVLVVLRNGTFAGTVTAGAIQPAGSSANGTVFASSGSGSAVIVGQPGDQIWLQAYRENPAHSGSCSGSLAVKMN